MSDKVREQEEQEEEAMRHFFVLRADSVSPCVIATHGPADCGTTAEFHSLYRCMLHVNATLVIGILRVCAQPSVDGCESS